MGNRVLPLGQTLYTYDQHSRSFAIQIHICLVQTQVQTLDRISYFIHFPKIFLLNYHMLARRYGCIQHFIATGGSTIKISENLLYFY